ncbi:MAG: TFIIB-type zinc ribbon-containing protein [Christensenellales bacterium]|jgi:hypothetical protein
MDKCPNCGNKLNSIDVLCPRCGAVVEVVQIKNQGASNPANSAPESQVNKGKKRDIPTNLIVYKDFPIDNTDVGNGLAHETEDSLVAEQKAYDQNGSAYPKINEHTSQPVDPSLITRDNSRIDTETNNTANLQEKSDGESSDSWRYLDMIKNMRLPEIDDLKDFDPEEFMREYRRTKSAYLHVPMQAEDEQTDSNRVDYPKKQWLEIEESPVSAPEENLFEKGVVEQDAQQNQPEDINAVKQAAESELQPADKGISEQTHRYQQQGDCIAESDNITRRFKQDDQSEHLRQNKKADKPSTRIRRKRPSIFLMLLFWILVAGVLFACFMFFDHYVTTAYGGYSNFIYTITDGKINVDTDSAYHNGMNISVSNTQTKDGMQAHLFSVSTVDGTSVNVIPLGKSFNLTNGHAEIIIADYDLAKSLGIVTDKNVYTTNDVIFEIVTKNSINIYKINDLILNLDPADYLREQPMQSMTSTSNASVTIALSISPNADVRINDTDYTRQISSLGQLSVDIPLTLGENIVTVEVVQTGKTTVNDIFTVTRQIPQAALIPTTEYLRVYNDAFTCTGSTDPGSKVTAQIDNSETIYNAEVKADGTYSLSFNIKDYGLHSIKLIATSKNKTEANEMIAVERIPDFADFSAEAKKMTISELKAKPDKMQNVPVKIIGTAKDIKAEGSSQSFSLYSDSDSLCCYYYGTEKLIVDKEYTLFGMFDASSSSFYVMYITS